MTAPAQNHGEPWEISDMKSSKGGWMIIGSELKNTCLADVYAAFGKGQTNQRANVERIVACVNALKGCPDPQTFVDAVKIMLFNVDLLDNGRYKNGEKIRLDMLSSFAGFICADAKEPLSWLKDKQ